MEVKKEIDPETGEEIEPELEVKKEIDPETGEEIKPELEDDKKQAIDIDKQIEALKAIISNPDSTDEEKLKAENELKELENK